MLVSGKFWTNDVCHQETSLCLCPLPSSIQLQLQTSHPVSRSSRLTPHSAASGPIFQHIYQITPHCLEKEDTSSAKSHAQPKIHYTARLAIPELIPIAKAARNVVKPRKAQVREVEKCKIQRIRVPQAKMKQMNGVTTNCLLEMIGSNSWLNNL